MNLYYNFYVKEVEGFTLVSNIMFKLIDVMWGYVYSLIHYLFNLGMGMMLRTCVMIMLGLGVLYMANGVKYPCSMTLTYTNPTWVCDQSLLKLFYSKVEYELSSDDII